jgi:hypothetical protein
VKASKIGNLYTLVFEEANESSTQMNEALNEALVVFEEANESSTQMNEALVVFEEANESICLWHQQLGHMNEKELKILINCKLLVEIQIQRI